MCANQRQAKYKPLLFTTTVRNPFRFKFLLAHLFPFNGQILTNEIMKDVILKLIQDGSYRVGALNQNTPTSIKTKWNDGLELSRDEALLQMEQNPQKHKEKDYARGWPSRFQTYFIFAVKLGFVWLMPGEKIEFSDSGKQLLKSCPNNEGTEKPQNEFLMFANAFAKYQRNNPFNRDKAKSVPLVLILEVIRLLDKDPITKSTGGISKAELTFLLVWKDDDAQGLYKTIKSFRSEHGFTPSNEIIKGKYQSILSEDDTHRADKSVGSDYTDEFIRKMMITGLFSLRGGGRYLGINTNENKVIDYILKTYSSPPEFTSEKNYFKYISKIDKQLLQTHSLYKQAPKPQIAKIKNWLNEYSWEIISSELIKLSQNKTSIHPELKLVPEPTRLEFLVTLAVLDKFPSVEVIPNYIADSEGFPITHAPGNQPDCICIEDKKHILLEPTLLTGVTQHIREAQGIYRHVNDYKKQNSIADCSSLLIAPSIHDDTKEDAEFKNNRDGIKDLLLQITIEDYVKKFEEFDTLNKTVSSLVK